MTPEQRKSYTKRLIEAARFWQHVSIILFIITVILAGIIIIQTTTIIAKAEQAAPVIISEIPPELVIEIETEDLSEPEPAEEPGLYEDLSDEDLYLLAKIAMAEAEGESLAGKVGVIWVILNRVESDEFPDTIEAVIFDDDQFAPVADGRWAETEPNQESWDAVQVVMTASSNPSEGALYFRTNTRQSTWHSRNLEYLYTIGNHSYYK